MNNQYNQYMINMLRQTARINPALNEMLRLNEANEPLNESVLDPVHKARCKEVFNDDDIMHLSVKRQIVTVAENWAKDNECEIKALKLIGSSSGFQYTDYSDIDVELDVECKNSTRNLIKSLPNGNNLEGTQHPVNYYLVNLSKGDSYDDSFAENIYDILNEKWIKKTDASDIKVPYVHIVKLSNIFSNSFDLTLSSYMRTKSEYDQYAKLEVDKYTLSESEYADAMQRVESDITAVYDALRLSLQLLHSFQNDAFANGHQFKITIAYYSDDPRWSVNNLVYKFLDKLGYRDRLEAAIKDCKDMLDNIKKDKKQSN